jgi:hypothetical protein
MRQCGDCQLCCKLLPVKSLAKLAGDRCSHQRHHKGCAVYATLFKVSPECRLWSCRWLTGDDTADLSRPDRSHLVIDLMPDYVTMINNETGEEEHIQVVQVWCDPNHRDAHREPAFRAYVERRAAEGIATLVRWNNREGMAIFAPAMSSDRQWHEVLNGLTGPEHSVADKMKALKGRIEMIAVEVDDDGRIA